MLVDPFATRLDRPFRLDDLLFDARRRGAAADERDSAPFLPKAIVEAPTLFRPPRRALVPWRDLVIYELHVKGFTAQREEVPCALRGTFSGLAHPSSIAHLTKLGVSAVELLPVAAFIDERHLPPLGLANYWGYNPIAMCALDPRLAPGGVEEARAAVEALQAAGIAVILDVVLNHSGESDELGPTLSLRGLDNAGYYRLAAGDPSRYVNDAGCGNVLALDRPLGLRLALDALRHFAMNLGVDGFRYDLASTLARRDSGFDPQHPLLEAIAQDPWLRDLIHIAEPWDLGPGGYQLGAFPACWGEWNDQSRDDYRRFWRGDPGRIGALASRLAGSADLFGPRHRPLSRSINFVTAHDGFTLRDLVSYARKHNEANGEENRDGTDENISWNGGFEGATSDEAISARRGADVRALLTTLFASRGTPMLSMGDELGRSQKGNNNAYAQDNALCWIDWPKADAQLIDFVGKLILLRRATPALNAEAALTGGPPDGLGIPDVEWLTAEGAPFRLRDWQDPAVRTLAAVFYDPGDKDRALASSRAAVILNGAVAATKIKIPDLRDGFAWSVEIDSGDPDGGARALVEGEVLIRPPRSAAILVERPAAERPARRSGVADHVLDSVAAAAGIALDWWDVDGRRHIVGAPTKRELLASLGLPAGSMEEARASLAELAEERELRPLPVSTTLRLGGATTLRLGGPLADPDRRIVLSITLEDGASRQIEFAPGEGRAGERAAADGRRAPLREIALPALPLGRHFISSPDAPEGGHLAIVPATAFLPPGLSAGARVFGVTVQLYALRRAAEGEAVGDQGVGDFTTLRRLGEAAAAAGAATVGINPLHALFPSDPERASPYHPSDRRFLDPLAIDISDLPQALLGAEVRDELSRAAAQAETLSATPFVDYSAVAALKRKLLAAAHAAFRRLLADHPHDPLASDYAAFVAAGGERLRRFALFQAIEVFVGGARGAFPPALRSVHGAAVEAFAEAHAQRLAEAMFLQWLAERQLAAAARAGEAAGLWLGFYRDLAVGCAPDGAEAWAEEDQLLKGVSIGAPPDPLGPNGQVWGLPPYSPRALARDGFSSFGALIAVNMAHAGLLRIDHVLGLNRLFLVPEGAEGKDGSYLSFPFEDLLGHVALESARAGAAVVGEDLGTVPEGLRARLAAARILSYRVMRFERDGAGFLRPERYPELAASCIATHDLPPLAGWWAGADLAEARRLGLLANAEAAVAARAKEKAEFARAIASPLLPEDQIDPAAPLSEEAAAAAHDYIARSTSVLALVQVDDLAMEEVAINMPGTDRERPNWRRKIGASVERLLSLPSAQKILAELRRLRARPQA